MARFSRMDSRSNRAAYESRRWTWPLVLLAVSLVLMLLPSAWTGRLMSLVQVLVPLQDAGNTLSDSIAESFGKDGQNVSFAEHQALLTQNQALSHQLAAACMKLQEVEQENQILTATRYAGGVGLGIGSAGRLVPARIVAPDILSWRTSRLINAGSLQGVRMGNAVTSHEFGLDVGAEAGLRDGMAILMAETLVGTVAQIGSHTSRVKLLSDVGVEMKVRIGRFQDDGFAALERYFWLVGRGDGVMEIGEVNKRDVGDGIIGIGDVVLSDPLSTSLPGAMVIGKITSIVPNQRKPLLSTLVVEGPVDLKSLDRVFVHDPDGEH